MFVRILIWLSIALTTNAFGAAGEFNPVRQHPTAEADPAVQRVIVKLRATEMTNAEEPAEMATLARRVHLSLKTSRQIAGSMHVIQVEPAIAGETVEAALARLRADPTVEYAEIDQRRYPHAIPNDPPYISMC